jgi:spore germination protein YaaH
LHAVTPDDALTIVDYERYQTLKATPMQAISLLKDDKLHRWMRSANVELPLMGLLDNYDGLNWRIKEMAAMLGNKTARHNLIRDVVDYTVGGHQAGVVVDFEEVPDASQVHFREFAAELGPALHSVGLKLMIALPARDDAYDYKFFGKECDAIVLMNYDQHWLTSPSGPIASQDWFVENLRQIMEDVPVQVVVVGIANYAYDWPESKSKEPAREMSVQEALLHAYESEADVEFDPTSLNPHYSYSDEHNHTHQVWMLDAVTGYN